MVKYRVIFSNGHQLRDCYVETFSSLPGFLKVTPDGGDRAYYNAREISAIIPEPDDNTEYRGPREQADGSGEW